MTQLLLLALAFALSAIIGVERERRLKSAGLRTHILVGLGSALFTLVSAYGFVSLGLPATDPSRIAAQVVTGIGFVGAGVIFVNRGNVVGLTTAASIWVTAA
ncbi:MgtC/SapB family protein, partial [Bacillus sp. SIMBA_069]